MIPQSKEKLEKHLIDIGFTPGDRMVNEHGGKFVLQFWLRGAGDSQECIIVETVTENTLLLSTSETNCYIPCPI